MEVTFSIAYEISHSPCNDIDGSSSQLRIFHNLSLSGFHNDVTSLLAQLSLWSPDHYFRYATSNTAHWVNGILDIHHYDAKGMLGKFVLSSIQQIEVLQYKRPGLPFFGCPVMKQIYQGNGVGSYLLLDLTFEPKSTRTLIIGSNLTNSICNTKNPSVNAVFFLSSIVQ